ncbi:RNA polymerase sigma factor, sigma-70 family [Nocardioides scoriae]|uniref:RNA polymerase sigma factor, sigma-70 family n=1 Tax=Nocardioides scoriae TaxID=642780 RepID=A0A1H1XUC4_9ACTN|nr:sigma-70 family RNA polymerase sigma factor [Nocardioides scoriae]SDT12827.1 RNA polymerase sigma factor, sigma-70 family [Nocardioides scoriae]
MATADGRTRERADADLADRELVGRVRAGDTEAFGVLFARHVDAARRLAGVLVPGPDADDLVSEAFTRTLAATSSGGGPDEAFRAYLLTAVRRLHVDRIRRQRRLTTSPDMTEHDPGVPFVDPAVADFEGGTAARAFASLPERWQLVLWHLEVENSKPAEVAPLLGVSPNTVSAIAYRAREGLRQAFVTMHGHDDEEVPEGCRTARDLLGGYVRGGLSRRDTRKVEDHLPTCRPCTAVWLELDEVNSSLSGLLAPVVLGAAAPAYAAAVGGASAAAATATAGPGLGLGRARDAVTSHLGTAVVASALVVGCVAVVVTRHHDPSGPDAGATAATSSPQAGPTARPSPSRAVPGTPQGPRGAASGAPTTTAPSSPAAPTAPAPTSDRDPAAGTRQEGSAGAGGGRDAASGTTGSAGSSRTREADLGVTARLVASTTPGRARLTASVSGVPSGRRATVTVRTSAGDLSPAGPGCTGGGTSLTCSVTSAGTAVAADVVAEVGAVVTVAVAPPSGWTDPVAAGNSVELRVP